MKSCVQHSGHIFWRKKHSCRRILGISHRQVRRRRKFLQLFDSSRTTTEGEIEGDLFGQSDSDLLLFPKYVKIVDKMCTIAQQEKKKKVELKSEKQKKKLEKLKDQNIRRFYCHILSFCIEYHYKKYLTKSIFRTQTKK